MKTLETTDIFRGAFFLSSGGTLEGVSLSRDNKRIVFFKIICKNIRELDQKESVFEKEQVLKIADRYALSEFTGSEINEAYKKLVGKKEIIQLAKNHYTTNEMQKIERQILQMVEKGRGQLKGIEIRKVEGYIETIVQESKSRGLQYTRDQKRAIQVITTTSDRHILVQGDAGTGKTTMIQQVKKILDKEGWQTMGFAFTGKIRGVLEEKTGISSLTIHKFLHSTPDIKKGKSMWIIDETSMVGSRQIHELIRLAKYYDAKVVIMGDKKQFPSILSGKPFSDLQENERIKMVELKDQVRQKEGTIHDHKVIFRAILAHYLFDINVH